VIVGRASEDEVVWPAIFVASWGVADGLPVDGVSDLLVDRAGFVWVATWDGLVRFDGRRFETAGPASGPGWPSHRVVQLAQARDGAIWAQTETGALVRVSDLDQLTVYETGATGRAHPLLEDREGRWLIVSPQGLSRFDGAGFSPLAPQTFAADPPTDLARSDDGSVWALTGGGRLYQIEGDQALEWPLRGGPEPGAARQLRPAPGGWWIGAETGLYRLSGHEAVRLQDRGQPWAPQVRGIEPAGEALWVKGRDGLLRWEDGAVSTLLPEAPLRNPGRDFVAVDAWGHTWASSGRAVLRDGRVVFRLPEGDASIADLEVDRYGTAWVGTDGAGLHQLIPPRIETLGAGAGEPLPNVYTVFADTDGALWFGASAPGMSRLAGDELQHFGEEAGFASEVRAMVRSRDGTLWVGQRKHGLGRWQDGRLEPELALPVAPVLALLERSDGTLLAGADDGLWARQGAWARVPGVPGGVRALSEGRDGVVWIGTAASGVYRLGPDGAEPVEVGASSIRSLWPDPEGGVWAGTEDAGLRHSGQAAPVSLAEGLPSRTVHALLEDGRGSLWGSTNRGLFRIPLSALAARAAGDRAALPIGVLTERDGMQDAEGNGGNGQAGQRLADGRLLFATQAGIVRLDPVHVEATSLPPPLVLEGLQVAGQPRARGGPARQAPPERSFGVDVGVLGLRDPDRALASWKLEGVDPDWVSARGARTAWYTDLSPGTYTFRLRGADADGTPSAQELSAQLTVEPWLSETWAFQGALGLLGLSGLGLAGWARLASLRRRQRELEALVEARTAALAAEKAVVTAQAARLAEVDRLKTRYFANLSHELRTPLTLLLGPLQDVREGRHGPIPDDAAGQLGGAERHARELFELVNQLLDVVKIDAGKLELRRDRYDLGALAQGVASGFAPLAARQGLRLAQQVPLAPVPVEVDARELAKVVGNLLSNAIKFTPRGGEVALTVEVAAGRAQLTVSDTGVGISAAGLRQVFDRFYVVEGASSGLQPGTGLGLALARELVELHGGQIEVTSVVGQGSSFRVTLPLSDGLVQALPEVPAPPVPPDEEGLHELPEDRTTVLVVDDHPDLRRWIARHLAPRYRVLEAADGLEALAVVRRELPDLVVTDVMMPGMDGHDLVRALRADPDAGLVPIVMLSARGGTDSQVSGLERGADAYLVKPFSSAVLRAQIDGLLTQRERLRQRLAAPRPPEPPDEALSADERYLRTVRAAIEAGHTDPEFGVQELADAVHQDRAHLFRRLKALTGEAPSDLIRTARLEHAARLLVRRAGSVSEIAYATGFSSLSYFSTSFRQRFGVAPSKYAGRDR
jgi:signal transduction histidine kinase/DNA-binding response OmpR family regulator/ligand-binding sensor domain-containing protein